MTGREFNTYLEELRDSIRMWRKDRCDDQTIMSLISRYFCDDARIFTGYQLGTILNLAFAELLEEKSPQSCSSKGARCK